MDREITPSHRRRTLLRSIFLWVTAVVVIGMSVAGFRRLLERSIDRDRLRTSLVERGPVEATLTASGIVVPSFEQVITSPVSTRLTQVYVAAGQPVCAGQQLLGLDCEGIRSLYTQETDELALERNRLNRLQLMMERALIELEGQVDIKQMNITRSENKVVQQQELYDLGLISEDQFRDVELSLNIARRELQALQENIANQKKAMQVDREELALKISIREQHLEELARKLTQAEMKSERSGVVTWVRTDIGASIVEGETLVRLADLSRYRVDASITDLHASSFGVGFPVRVRVNEKEYPGRVESIEPAIRDGVIRFKIAFESDTPEKLRPNQRCDVFIVLSEKEDVLRVENGPFFEMAGLQPIFVIKGQKAVRRNAQLGTSNFEYVEIVSGVELGEEVIISDMSEYLQVPSLELR